MSYESFPVPQNLDAEAAVLGSLLIDNDAFEQVAEAVTTNDFYKQSHRLLYCVLADLITKGEPAEFVTVVEELRKRGQVEAVGGINYLIGLTDSVSTSAYARTYAGIVAEKARLRDLVAVGQRITQGGLEDTLTFTQLIAQADAELTALSRNVQTGTSDDEALEAALGYLDGTAKLKTGFVELDRATGGLPVGDLTVLAARSTTGKSSWAYQIAINIASETGEKVGILSPDQEKGAIVAVLGSRVSGVPLSWIEARTATPAQRQRFYDGVHYVRDHLLPRLVIRDGPLRPASLEAEVNKLLRQGCAAIFVDTLQAMNFSESKGSDLNVRTQMGTAARTLKALARTYRIPVVAISQIPAATDYNKDKRPSDFDLSEDKSLYTLAQLQLMMYREGVHGEHVPTPGLTHYETAEIRVAKQKTGAKNVIIRLRFHAELQLFYNRTGEAPGVYLKDTPFAPVEPLVTVTKAPVITAKLQPRGSA